MMRPLHLRDHVVAGPYTMKGGNLTFRTGGALLGSEARMAMTGGREFTICLTPPGVLKYVTGKVMNVKLIEGAKPAQWEIVMRVSV